MLDRKSFVSVAQWAASWLAELVPFDVVGKGWHGERLRTKLSDLNCLNRLGLKLDSAETREGNGNEVSLAVISLPELPRD